MRKEKVVIDAGGNAFVLSKLLSVVGRQRMHPVRKRRRQGDDGIGNGLGSFTRHLANQRVARFAFVERDQCLLLAGADNEVIRRVRYQPKRSLGLLRGANAQMPE